MSQRVVGFAGAAVMLAVTAAAQTASTSPRTPEGWPDLQGTWYVGTATPLERPKEFEGKPFLTPEEVADFERRTAERISRTQAVHAPGWLDYGPSMLPDRRSSLIIDPPDGRVPALTAEGRRKATARAEDRRGAADGPEDLNPQERCLVFGAGPPLLPGPYNNHVQIVQTPEAVTVFTEMIHDARIVPLDGRPPLPADLRFWLGASRGRWDGDTLVVETTNFTRHVSFRGSDEHLRVTERFTREGPDALRYEFTIENPTAFTRPWTAAFTMTRTDDAVYEFACHEGNYGLLNILRAARFEDGEATRVR
jgi:hypothetical protein